MKEPQQPEIFADLAHHVASTLQEMVGMEDDIAEQIAVAVANRMMQAWGGQTNHLPAQRHGLHDIGAGLQNLAGV